MLADGETRRVLVVGEGSVARAAADEFRSLGDAVVTVPPSTERVDLTAGPFHVACLHSIGSASGAGPSISTEQLLELASRRAEEMIRGGGGAIVTLSSLGTAATAHTDPLAVAAAAGLRAGSVALATAVGKGGVRVNALAVDPSIAAGTRSEGALLPRAGTARDVARVAAFLASEEAAFITGVVLRVDGGLLAHLPHTSARKPDDG